MSCICELWYSCLDLFFFFFIKKSTTLIVLRDINISHYQKKEDINTSQYKINSFGIEGVTICLCH